MSLRLSALFEEHISPILADYKAIHGLTDRLTRQGTDRQTRHTTDRQTRHAMKRRRRRSDSPASSTASRYQINSAFICELIVFYKPYKTLANVASSPERKRRVSSRGIAKREPSPPQTRPPFLRQNIPSKQPPQLVNGKADTPAAGRTRSSARHAALSPPSSTQNNTSNSQTAAGDNASNAKFDTLLVSLDLFQKPCKCYHVYACFQSRHDHCGLITLCQLQQRMREWHHHLLLKTVEEAPAGNSGPLYDTH